MVLRCKNLHLEVISITQLWTLQNKTATDISDQKLKKALGKLKMTTANK